MSPVLPRCFAGFFLVSFALTGCGGGGGGGGGASPPATATSTYTISGSVSGLSGIGLVLQNNGADNLPVSTTNFTFSTPVTTGGAYSVTVFTQPTGQTCSVANGSGAVGSANITTVQVSCANNLPPAPSTYTIGGTISGLTGNGLVLRNNGGDNLALSPASAASAFTFNTAIATGNPYNVTVFTQPTGQLCTVVTGGSGTVAGANITNAQVSCVANSYTISGNVSGLVDSGLVLQNNGTDNRTISANGPFTFATALASGPYSVTVLAQPGNPGQTCSVTNGSGTLAGANITNVQVNCVTNTYTISGNVSGLTGSGLVLQNNLGNNRAISTNGAFTFSSAMASGSNYSVTVSTQPSGQTCSVTNGGGTVASAPITNVLVSCANNPAFTVGGSVANLSGSGLVLQNNGGNNLSVSSGSFTFTTAIASGSSYNVTLLTQPTGQTCTVSNGSGTVSGANITTVTVSCANTSTFTVGGTVTGLTGNGLALQNNGGDDRTISVNGSFSFTTSLADTTPYSVAILTQSTGQTCTVTNGSGTIANANVTNVQVNCVSNPTFTIGGTVANLVGSGLVLQNNGANNLSVSTSNFVFSTQIATGAPYSVTILTQPTGQTCSVTNSSGTVAGTNVTDVGLNCIANTYTISGTVSGLTGSGLILRNNGTDNRSISANGAFAFNTAIASSNPYSVTVFAQPTGQSCNVTGGSGTVAAANVTNVRVNCVVTNTYTISGNVSGPLNGTPFPGGVLTLQNNGGDPVSLTNYGAFTFPAAVASGLPYNVTVFQQPATNWTCVPTRATGVVGTANITDIQVSCVDNTVVSTGSMGVARNHHSATLLADGKVMVAGGWATSATVSLSSAEIFDPIGAGAFTATAPMNIARSNHTATLLLASGKVLVAGGLNGSLNLNSAEVFDPAGTFSLTGTAMTSARSNHAVALLGDGTVLLAGGRGGAGSPIQSAEIYDPATGTGAFSATTGPMAELRMFHTATRLNTGMVLIVGGKDAGFELLTAEIYDPVTRTFSATGAMSAIRQNHTATLLADGKVLIVGGAQNGATGNPISSAEVYDPITGLFHPTGNMATARADHAATLLANGKVLISGGRSTSNVSSALRTMEIYDPASGLFANAGSMSSARTDHAATLLLSPVLNPRVLITGGYDGTSVVNTADLFVPQ